MPPNLAAVFADSVAEICARKRDQDEMVSGAQSFWSHEELTQNDAPLSPARRNLQAVTPDGLNHATRPLGQRSPGMLS